MKIALLLRERIQAGYGSYSYETKDVSLNKWVVILIIPQVFLCSLGSSFIRTPLHKFHSLSPTNPMDSIQLYRNEHQYGISDFASIHSNDSKSSYRANKANSNMHYIRKSL